MTKKYTEEEANELDRKCGAIPIGQYINNRTKRAYKCNICGDIYYAQSAIVRMRKQIFCPKCSHKKTIDKQRNNINFVKSIIVKKGFEPLFENNDYCNANKPIKIKCKCGRIFYSAFFDIQMEKTKSCGHCTDANINDRFGKLKVIIIFPYHGRGSSLVCECDCGNDTKIEFGSKLINGSIKSCGHCGLQRNGNFTSHVALQLHNLIESITNIKWEHNLHIKNCGCIDIANEQLKIAIEYDSYYNHKIRNGDHTQKDKEKIQKLLKSGWKVLRIKSNGRDIPTEKQLYKILLNDFQHNTHKRTITMKSWKDMAKQYESDRS